MPEFPPLEFGWSVQQVSDYMAGVVGWVLSVPYISIGLSILFGLWVVERIARIVWRISSPRDQSPVEVDQR